MSTHDPWHGVDVKWPRGQDEQSITSVVVGVEVAVVVGDDVLEEVSVVVTVLV